MLVDGDDHNDPVADAVRGTLDGHIVLDRAIAEQGRYPAVNLLSSLSRLSRALIFPNHSISRSTETLELVRTCPREPDKGRHRGRRRGEPAREMFFSWIWIS